jgi:hypothetical protein
MAVRGAPRPLAPVVLVAICLGAGGCSGGSAPAPAGSTSAAAGSTSAAPASTSAAPASAAPVPRARTPVEWANSGGRNRIAAIQALASDALGPDVRSIDRGRCAALQAAVAEAVTWTAENDVPDTELARDWQAALTSYGAMATACLDLVDHRDTRTNRETQNALVAVARSNADGSDALSALDQRLTGG